MKEEHKPNSKLTKKSSSTSNASIGKLANLRIIQKHLVYVIGLSTTLANKDVRTLLILNKIKLL